MEEFGLMDVQLHDSLVIIVPVLLIIGYALKQTPKCPDWIIVWVMLILGGTAGILTVGNTVEGLSNGLIAGGLAIASHQVYKQTKANTPKKK